MPKIGNYKESHESPCIRCGSKRKKGKKRIEKISNPNSEGFMVLEHIQIICTNKECQKEFEKKLVEEEEKRLKIKEERERNSSASAKSAQA